MPGTKALCRAMPKKLSTDHQCCALSYFSLLSNLSVHAPSTLLCVAANSRSSPRRTYALARTEPPAHPRASLPVSPKHTAVRCLGTALSIPRRSALARERGVFFPCFDEGVEVLVRRNGAAKLRVGCRFSGRRITKRAPAAGSVHMSPPWSRTV